jgi:hypothetical protein
MNTKWLLRDRLVLSTVLVAGMSLTTASGARATVVLLPGFCSPNCEADASLDPMRLVFDEFGNASIARNGGAAVPLKGALGADPSNNAPGAPLALIYKLPENVISGTVIFTEPGGGTSDALRFTDNTGVINGGATNGTLMIFYSELEVGELNPAPGDTGFPGNLRTGLVLTRNEIGLENGRNGFTYNPGALYPLNNQYVGISDSVVPELSTWVMMALGFVGLGFTAYRRARARTQVSAF